MRKNRGFTLLETLFTTSMLVFGLAALALVFAYTARSSINAQQRMTATLLLSEKLEELRGAAFADGSLPPGEHIDYPAVAEGSFIRQWVISETTPRSITVVVSAVRGGFTGRSTELIRASTLVGKGL